MPVAYRAFRLVTHCASCFFTHCVSRFFSHRASSLLVHSAVSLDSSGLSRIALSVSPRTALITRLYLHCAYVHWIAPYHLIRVGSRVSRSLVHRAMRLSHSIRVAPRHCPLDCTSSLVSYSLVANCAFRLIEHSAYCFLAHFISRFVASRALSLLAHLAYHSIRVALSRVSLSDSQCTALTWL